MGSAGKSARGARRQIGLAPAEPATTEEPRMQMFTLKDQTAVFVNLNPRPENHGTEKVPACDLKFSVTVPSAMLNSFENKLREAFYRKPKGDEVAGDLADQGSAPEDGMVKLRCPQLGTLAWDREYPGYVLGVHFGIDEQAPIHIEDTTIAGLRFDCKDGGSVAIAFTVKSKPTEEQAGRLYGLMGREVTIDLTPPDGDPE